MSASRKAFVNRWGARLEVGAPVTVVHPRGGETRSTIARIETSGEYARAYGPRVVLATGGSASVDDCRIGWGAARVVVRFFGAEPQDGEPMTWDEFVDANRDGMSAAEFRCIAATLAKGETYFGGGGADARWSVRRA